MCFPHHCRGEGGGGLKYTFLSYLVKFINTSQSLAMHNCNILITVTIKKVLFIYSIPVKSPCMIYFLVSPAGAYKIINYVCYSFLDVPLWGGGGGVGLRVGGRGWGTMDP